MRVVIQRVKQAKLDIDGETYAKIGEGLVLLLGVSDEDTQNDLDWIVKKTVGMRIFSNAEGKFDHALNELEAELLIVSQFTLFASTKKGNRPSFIKAGTPAFAEQMYEQAIVCFRNQLGNDKVKTGKFGQNMQVLLENDGPVSIILDSKQKE
ncbi:MAG: D-aminoacyl-tRNA deacylase [Flavobacteriales bacterium]